MTSQREMFTEVLKQLSQDITKEDRINALKELKIKSPATISNYLNGVVRNNDTAASLISFFKKRISERNQVLV